MIGNFFPSSNFIGNCFNAWSGRTIGIAAMTGVNGRIAPEKTSHAAKIEALMALQKNTVTSNQMDGIERHLPGPTFLADIIEIRAIKKPHIMTKFVVVQSPTSTNCPKFIGSSGSLRGATENSLNCSSEMSS